MKPLLILYCLLCAVSCTVCFMLCFVDKRAARLGRRRIPEKQLLMAALFGGGAGLWLGMNLFRHKTRHLRFVVAAPLLTSLQLAGLVLLAIQTYS